jgi:hypothetical protein
MIPFLEFDGETGLVDIPQGEFDRFGTGFLAAGQPNHSVFD